MKTKLYVLAIIAFALCVSLRAQSQANTTLSNLVSPTAINQDLSPNSNNVHNLGSVAENWKILYIDNSIYLKGALFLHNAGVQNTFVGQQSGDSLLKGTNNTAVGFKSLSSVTNGAYNTANGTFALYANTSGLYNTANGEKALFSNTIGYSNVKYKVN